MSEINTSIVYCPLKWHKTKQKSDGILTPSEQKLQKQQHIGNDEYTPGGASDDPLSGRESLNIMVKRAYEQNLWSASNPVSTGSGIVPIRGGETEIIMNVKGGKLIITICEQGIVSGQIVRGGEYGMTNAELGRTIEDNDILGQIADAIKNGNGVNSQVINDIVQSARL